MSKVGISSNTRKLISEEIEKQALPEGFIAAVLDYYLPLSQALNDRAISHEEVNKTIFVGIQGSQGSGKSTVADFLKIILESEFNKPTLVMSIDDFYLTKAERKELSDDVHPLFLTRGVPGTHDIDLLNSVFKKAAEKTEFNVPMFDKSIDDRAPESQKISKGIDIVILEGWCVGLSAQDEGKVQIPVNSLEEQEDANLIWRSFVNSSLEYRYQPLFDQLDYQVFLQAPSFECVYDWRLLQETKMIERLTAQGLDASGAQTPKQIERFISHYQRLTQHALETMPAKSDCVLALNEDHSFRSIVFN